MYEPEYVSRLPRLSVILNLNHQIYDKPLFKRIFDYGIIETYTVQGYWNGGRLGGIDHIAFKILLANPDEIYSFLQKIKEMCWKAECWLIRRKKPPKILYSWIGKGNDVTEEDYFWELDFELYEETLSS